MDCPFCKLIQDTSQSSIIYENDLVLAFLDINPVSDGHTLIIPKNHYFDIYDIPEEELKEIILTAKRISLKYKEEKGINAVNILHASNKIAQQSVFHFHIHLVPRRKNDGLDLWLK